MSKIDINEIPEKQLVLLHFDKFPAPLPGQHRPEFSGGIALVLPCFELRPDSDASKDDLSLFECYPGDWLHETVAGQLELANLHVNINPKEVSLVVPPPQWTLIAWSLLKKH